MRLRLSICAACLLVAACNRDKATPPEPNPATSVPAVALSAQPWVSGAPVVPMGAPPATSARAPETDGREAEAGAKIGKDAASGCSEKTCLLEKCGKLCTAWMNETYPTFKSTRQRNNVYFGCLGACLSAGQEAGVKFPEKP